MKDAGTPGSGRRAAARTSDFPLATSVGAAVRFTHLAFAEDLQARLAAHRVSAGMWFLLRSLWEEDGITQRELSRRVGVTEPTTVQQLRNMVNMGIVVRKPSTTDKRKMHVHLSASGRALERELLPYAREVNLAALEGIPAGEIERVQRTLERMRANLARRRAQRQATDSAGGGRG